MINKRSLVFLSCILLIIGSALTLAHVPSQKTASQSQWHIKSLGENRTEIVGPGATYSVQSSATGVSIDVLRQGKTVETDSFERNGHEYVLTASAGTGRIRLTIKTAQDKVTTDVELPSEHFTVESDPMGHGLKLAKELKSHSYPPTPYLTQLVTELRSNKELREQFSRATGFERVMQVPDGPIVACVAVCAACAAEFAPACPACILCIMNEGAVHIRP